ncbi:hypothetical protein DPEC_G00067710 [Dallia pectoralis]|uniref:Uncharacterized protein n=1 Tax=Dallia pectoralis TaxID=75939 RepID=A0ACC2H1D2_DALPE|nr:hypothetical protein DPEC_G00067710 [Dallia pectoralis]
MAYTQREEDIGEPTLHHNVVLKDGRYKATGIDQHWDSFMSARLQWMTKTNGGNNVQSGDNSQFACEYMMLGLPLKTDSVKPDSVKAVRAKRPRFAWLGDSRCQVHKLLEHYTQNPDDEELRLGSRVCSLFVHTLQGLLDRSAADHQSLHGISLVGLDHVTFSQWNYPDNREDLGEEEPERQCQGAGMESDSDRNESTRKEGDEACYSAKSPPPQVDTSDKFIVNTVEAFNNLPGNSDGQTESLSLPLHSAPQQRADIRRLGAVLPVFLPNRPVSRLNLDVDLKCCQRCNTKFATQADRSTKRKVSEAMTTSLILVIVESLLRFVKVKTSELGVQPVSQRAG